jgi:hypothetical protein
MRASVYSGLRNCRLVGRVSVPEIKISVLPPPPRIVVYTKFGAALIFPVKFPNPLSANLSGFPKSRCPRCVNRSRRGGLRRSHGRQLRERRDGF